MNPEYWKKKEEKERLSDNGIKVCFSSKELYSIIKNIKKIPLENERIKYLEKVIENDCPDLVLRVRPEKVNYDSDNLSELEIRSVDFYSRASAIPEEVENNHLQLSYTQVKEFGLCKEIYAAFERKFLG